MEVIKSKHDFLLLLLLMIFGVVNRVHGNIADFDEVWKERAEKAHQEAMAAYDPNPELVSQNLTIEVESCVKEDKKHSHSKSGRHLRDKGQCQATNPIDRCWRCQADWEQNRKRLADCVLGFGRNTIGGKDGRIYVVTDASDDHLVNPPEGTLRHAVIQDGPLWIIFARSMIIRLSEELIVNSNKTIDGRGCNIQIMNGAGITIQYVQNVIIHGLHIHDIKAGGGAIIRDSPTHFGQRTRSDGDGISIFGSSRVWIDHISMSNCMDGLIDAIEMSTAITISNCHFTHHNEVMLLGASDSSTKDENMQITIAFNHFGRGLVQRMPRCRFGFFHVVNNDYTHWIMYAVGGSQHPTIYSQGNRYIAPHLPNAKEGTKRDYATEDEWKHWQWRSEGDLFVNGAFFVESGVDNKTKPRSSSDMISYKPGSYAGRLTRYSGALNCKTGVPC